MARLALSVIRTDGGTQTRATINADTVADYAEAMRGGAEFPAVTVFYDGSAYWLADGFHRWQATAKAGRGEIDVDIRQGTRRDAVLFSVGANSAHGLRRTNEDKRRAVMTLLGDSEWSQWPQTDIARACGVSREYVRLLAKATPVSCQRLQDATRTVTRGGATYQQNTANIGRTGEAREATPPRSAPEPPVRSQIASTIPTDAAADHYAVFVLNGLDRILAAAEHWPDPAEALGHLRQFPNFSRKLPVVGGWLARLLELSGNTPTELAAQGATSHD